MSTLRVHFDECVPSCIQEEFRRRRGIRCTPEHDLALLRGVEDEHQLKYAAENNRIFVTTNHKDFCGGRSPFLNHSGIVVFKLAPRDGEVTDQALARLGLHVLQQWNVGAKPPRRRYIDRSVLVVSNGLARFELPSGDVVVVWPPSDAEIARFGWLTHELQRRASRAA